jgi:hypothetical protein
MTAMPNSKLLKNQKPVCSVVLVAKPEFEHESSRTQCEPKLTVVIVAASQQASEAKVLGKKQASAQNVQSGVREVTAAAVAQVVHETIAIVVVIAMTAANVRLVQIVRLEPSEHLAKISHQ